MMLVANLDKIKLFEIVDGKKTGTLAYWYSSDRAQLELSNEYQHDRVWTFIKYFCNIVLSTKVDLASQGSTIGIGMDTRYRTKYQY